ncbi:MAG: thiopeptide-type bacteriocin biosynthesis protein, partial [Bacteroidota bacterium]
QFEAQLTSDKDYGRQIQDHLEELSQLAQSEEIQRIKTAFDRIIRQVRALNETASANDVGAYKNIIAQLKDNFPFEIGKKVFHIDGYRSSKHTTLNKKIKKDLLQLFAFFNRINAGAYDTKPEMEAFKAKFRARYDSKEVLLINALDRDFGIGYPVDKPSVSGSLVDNLPFNYHGSDLQVTLSKKDQWLLEILQLPENRGKYAIHLDQHTIPFENKNNWEQLPSTISSMFRVLNDDKETILFEFFFGPSGASLPSRFSFGSQEIKNTLRKIVQIEDDHLENAHYAEFTHMSDSKYANVVIHPSFRDHEIPYLAMPAVEEDKQITVDDLYIKLEYNRIVLFSKKLNKEILPCKTHVHNHFSQSLPLYHFLGDLQNAPVNKSMHFSWGNLKQLFYFVPRTYFKDIIISPAEWNLHISVFQGLNKLADDELFHQLKALRERFNLPQKILHSELDNDLIVDFNDLLSVRSWLKIINSKSLVTMKEFLWIIDEAPEEPTHLMQYVATLVNEQKKAYKDPIPTPLVNQASAPLERDFILGSEWVYFKLYCGINSADYVLLNVLGPIIKNISQADLIKKWFFIKYTDVGGYHLRLRFQLKDTTKIGALYQLFYEGIHRSPESQLINKIQADTYQREIERYGANTIDLCESIFHIDSATTIELLKYFTADEQEVFKTVWSLQMVDQLLNGFKVPLEDKINFVDLSRKSFQQEFGTNKYTTRSINQKYSQYQELIKEVMNEAPRFQPLLQLLKNKSMQINEHIDQILSIAEQGKLQVEHFQLLSSIIHMMLNRFITHKERIHELLIFEFLFKQYKTKFYLEKVH